MTLYSLTLNPALDLSGHVPSIVPDEKNYVTRRRVDPGGNGINAARMAARLGCPVTLLGFLGGSAGDRIEELLANGPGARRMARRFTRIAAETRTNVTVTNDTDHHQTRLTFPGPDTRASERRALLSEVSRMKRDAIFIVGGSVPDGCDPSFLRAILRAAARRGARLIVDVPAPLLSALLKGRLPPLWMIKPNLPELEGTAGRKLGSQAAIIREARRLIKRVECVCVSLGSKGALAVTAQGAWGARSPHVRSKGSVGAGDSMVGAMASRLARGESWAAALRWGVAAGAATAETEGTSLSLPQRVRELVSETRVESLSSASKGE